MFRTPLLDTVWQVIRLLLCRAETVTHCRGCGNSISWHLVKDALYYIC